MQISELAVVFKNFVYKINFEYLLVFFFMKNYFKTLIQ